MRAPAITAESIELDLSALQHPSGWKRKTLRSPDGLCTLLHAEHPAPTLEVPLPVNGPHHLHLGLVTRPNARNTAMQVRIEPGGHWRRVRPMRFLSYDDYGLQDVELGVHQLRTGSRLLVRTEPRCEATLARVHLSPGVKAQVPRHRHNVGVVFDTNMTMSNFRMEEPSDLLAALEPLVESDVSHVFWGTAVGTYSPLYFSESLGWHGRDKASFSPWHREATANVMRMFDKFGVDPLRYAVEFAHANGLQLWANYRVSKNHEQDFQTDYTGGRFLVKHRDKLVLTPDGSPHPQLTMSYAFPVVREMAVRSLVEQVSYGVDGLYIDFVRKYPLVGWEPNVVDDFQRLYGKDPKRLPSIEWQLDWFNHISHYVTQFLRELRVALQPLEHARGRRIPIAVQVPGGWRFQIGVPNSLMDAMDPITWAREGLIDILAPAEWTALMLEVQSLDRFSTLLAGSGCKLWGAIGPQFREALGTNPERAAYDWAFADTDPWRYMSMAHDYYSQGADGVYLWESHEMPAVPQRWDVIRRLGDRDYLAQVFGNKIGRFDGSHWVHQSVLKPEGHAAGREL